MTQPKTRAPAKRAAAAAGEAQRSRRGRPVPPEHHLRAERRLERRCDALRAELEALERARAELCSALSHDLRNPLTVVVWSTQMLTRRMPPEDAARRHLDAISRAAEEMNQMLHDLSDAARIPDGRLPLALVLERTDLAALVEQAAAPSRALAESKEMSLTVAVAAELGQICCDRERVTRVLGTLVGNAVRRTPKGGAVSVRASRDADDERDDVRIVVEDAGPEIPADDRASLFMLPAAPPPSGVRRARSIGPAIALFVARGVIEAHGGRLWLEGEPGRGARFLLTLPMG